MESVLNFLKEIAQNWDQILLGYGELKVAIAALSIAFFAFVGSFSTVVGIVYGICLIIPGPKPDIWVKKILDFTQKYSRK